MKKIELSQHFSYRKLIAFTLPSVFMMVITSVYSIVDGLFVSNIVGELALSAVNVVFPLSMMIGAFGFMLGSGGSALVAKTMGEGKRELANRYFSMIVGCVVLLGAVLSALCIAFMRPITRFMGATPLIEDLCVEYGYILIGGSIVFMLQTSLQCFFIVAEKPAAGMMLTIFAGITNIILDYVFIKVLSMGIKGAGLATVAGYCVGAIPAVLYFMLNKKGVLKLVKTRFYPKEFAHACANGSSELMSNISASIVSMLYNVKLAKMIGETGIAAYSAIMYTDFVFIAIMIGFSMGVAPIVSFNYGAANESETKSVFKKCMTIVVVTSAIMFVSAEALSYPLAYAFVGYNQSLTDLTVRGFRLFAISYIFCGLNIFASAYFTALCNGAVSAGISFLRTLVLRGGSVMLLPLILDLDGVWLAVVVAEALTFVVSAVFFKVYKKRYNYA